MRIAIASARAPRTAITSAIAIRIALALARAHRTAITIAINGYGAALIAKQLISAPFGPFGDVNLYTLSCGFQSISREIFCFIVNHYSALL
jgi:hypothetical protein